MPQSGIYLGKMHAWKIDSSDYDYFYTTGSTPSVGEVANYGYFDSDSMEYHIGDSSCEIEEAVDKLQVNYNKPPQKITVKIYHSERESLTLYFDREVEYTSLLVDFNTLMAPVFEERARIYGTNVTDKGHIGCSFFSCDIEGMTIEGMMDYMFASGSTGSRFDNLKPGDINSNGAGPMSEPLYLFDVSNDYCSFMPAAWYKTMTIVFSNFNEIVG